MINKKPTAQMKIAVEYILSHPGCKRQDIADACGVHYQTVTSWYKNQMFLDYYDEQLKIAWEDTIRVAQRQIAAKVARGEKESCFFVLKTQQQFNAPQRIEAELSGDININIE